MSNHFDCRKILIITPEIACIPGSRDAHSKVVTAHQWQLTGMMGALIGGLNRLGADIHVAQPDYRRIFRFFSQNKQVTTGQKFPADKVCLSEDRVFFYSDRLDCNREWENIRISIAFQREVINTILPQVEPDLIHCHNWMTGLIPAVARELDIPCLFSVYKIDTGKSPLSYIEDMGIDAATFWQHLYFSRYPLSYEETRETNPADFLLSGIYAAHLVNIINPAPALATSEDCGGISTQPIKQLLDEKWKARSLVFNSSTDAKQYISLYERILCCPIIKRQGNKEAILRRAQQ